MKRSLFLVLIVVITISLSIPLISPHIQRALFPLKYSAQIDSYSEKLDLDPYLISAIIYEESRFKKDSRSSAGAIGLMQIMPETARWISSRSDIEIYEGSLLIPEVNIAMGTWYFSWLLKKYQNETLALAAYNGGDKNIDRWLEENDNITDKEFIKKIPFKETRNFVERVRISRTRYKDLYPKEFLVR